MSMRLAVTALVLVGLNIAAGNVRAAGPGIKGMVVGTDGKPLAGAEVRAQRIDGKSSVIVATTDAKGQYSLTGLDLAAYRVTTVVNKVPKSVASVRTRNSAWVRVDFSLAQVADKSGRSAKKSKRYVWVAGETGTHIGNGHWEAVDDTTANGGANPLERVDGSAVHGLQNSILGTGGGSKGGGN
jgi:carboxypeptidase family protein